MSVSGRPRCAAGIIAGKCLERAPPLQKPQGWVTQLQRQREPKYFAGLQRVRTKYRSLAVYSGFAITPQAMRAPPPPSGVGVSE